MTLSPPSSSSLQTRPFVHVFAHMVARLKPGGVLVLQGYTPKQLEYRTGGPPLVSHLYTEPMLRSVFADMDLLTLTEYEADVAGGVGHRGRSALMGLVARRRLSAGVPQ